MSDLAHLAWGFAGPGTSSGVYSALTIQYPSTLHLTGHMTVDERIARADGTVISLGAVATVPIAYGPADFAGLSFPDADPATGVVNPAVTHTLGGLFRQLYSLMRHRTAQHVAELAAAAAAAAAAQDASSPAA